jgi:hypothetical protein
MIMVMHVLLYSSLRIDHDLYRFLERWVRMVVVEVRLYRFIYGRGQRLGCSVYGPR